MYVTSSTANYTCVAKNVLGVSRKTFLVSRKGQFVYTFVVPVVSSVVLLVLGIVEWKVKNLIYTFTKINDDFI